MGERAVIGFVLVALVALMPGAATGHSGGVSLSGRGIATIDGVVTQAEWLHAAALPFDANVPGGGTAPAVFRVMNDATNLYFSLTVAHTGPQQTVALGFDNDHDASNGPEDGDDGLSFGFGTGLGGLNDNVRTTRPPCPAGSICGLRDTEAGGTIDGSAAQSTVGGETHFEVSHPLNSADDLNDFGLGIGDTVGFGFQYVVEGIFTVPAAFNPMLSDIVVATPLPALSIGNAGVFEGNAGTTDATFTVSLTPASTETVTVSYGTANGSARAPDDYAASSGWLTFTPGQVSQTVTVPVFGDTAQEPTESFFVNLYAYGLTNAAIADGQGVGTITDDDVPPGNLTLTLLNGGTGFGTVTGTGIACGADCFESYAPLTPVTLTATAGHGSVFAGWTNCDAPSGASCTMTMNADKNVTASFTATPTFADVGPSNPFYEYIEHLFDLGITTGCGTNGVGALIYCPDHPVPRQQMAAFLVRAKGLTQLFPATPSFVDVPASNPFFGYIERLKEQGITTGCNPPANDRFCPADLVPRQQMAAFLIRAKGLTQLFPATPSFLDVPTSNPFFGYIERLKQQAITTGCNPPANNLYCPVENVPRQQMAAFLIRAFGS